MQSTTTAAESTPIQATVCNIIKDNKILLMKRRSDFGKGKWSAPGGKVERGEAPESSTIREVFEETGLSVKTLELMGMLNVFKGTDEGRPAWIVHVFLTEEFEGELKESNEGELRWFDVHSLPFEEMWPDDRHWYGYLLQRRRFEGYFCFTNDFAHLVSHRVKGL